MRLVFLGTPDFAVPSLKALVNAGYEVEGVFTQPDRPAGRGKQTKPSPVKVVAQELGLAIFQPERIKTPEAVSELRRLNPECIVVVAYGQILSKELLTLPKWGCVNVHASLLPDYRGAAPIHWAVLNGEKVTGVTTMQMDEGLDTGDILLKAEYPISPNATTGEIHDVLAELGGNIILETLAGLQQGTIQQVPQAGKSSYAPLLQRGHEEIRWIATAEGIHNQVRGLNPWPGAFTTFRGESLKVWRTVLPLIEDDFNADPGEVVKVTERGLWIYSGDFALIEIQEVQPAGKRRMPARDFFLGRHGEIGECFG